LLRVLLAAFPEPVHGLSGGECLGKGPKLSLAVEIMEKVSV
jgi:hypothetical protein